MPLAVFNKNQGEIARARRESDLAGAQKMRWRPALLLVEQAYRQYSVSRQLLTIVETDMLLKAKSVRDITEYSYRRGEASLSGSAAGKAQSGIVILGPDAPELKEMAVEAVKDALMPAQEVTATARIEANPNRVDHAMAPVPGRIVQLMVQLGDSVSRVNLCSLLKARKLLICPMEFVPNLRCFPARLGKFSASI